MERMAVGTKVWQIEVATGEETGPFYAGVITKRIKFDSGRTGYLVKANGQELAYYANEVADRETVDNFG